MVEAQAGFAPPLSLSALFSTLAPLHVAPAPPAPAPHSHPSLGHVHHHLSRRDAHDLSAALALDSPSRALPAPVRGTSRDGSATAAERALVEVRRVSAAATAQATRATVNGAHRTMEAVAVGGYNTMPGNGLGLGLLSRARTMVPVGGVGGVQGAVGASQHLLDLSSTSPTRVHIQRAQEHKSHSRRAALARGDVCALEDALQVRRTELVAVERERERALLELRELQAHSHSPTGAVCCDCLHVTLIVLELYEFEYSYEHRRRISNRVLEFAG